MICPICEKRMKVVDTKELHGQRYRFYRCADCDYREYTREEHTSNYAWASVRAEYDRLRKEIRK